MEGGWIFLKTFHASLFNNNLSNEPNFGWIHLAGQYLEFARQNSVTAAFLKSRLLKYELTHMSPPLC
jgi:hypothetical protein